MTIAAYVLGLLLVLTFVSHNYLLEKQAIPIVNEAYLECKAKARKTRNEREIEKFLAYAKTNKPKATQKEKKKARTSSAQHTRTRTKKERVGYAKEQRARRTKHRSKLNLAPLSTSSSLRAMAIELLISLYEETSLFKEREHYIQELAPLIIDRLLGQRSSPTEALNSMRAAHPILYKMLLGTARYDIEKKRGYPPLSDFFTVESHNPKAIFFHYASTPLLQALFGTRIQTLILALEKKKWEDYSLYPYSRKDEAFAILVKEKKSAGYEELEPFLSFAR